MRRSKKFLSIILIISLFSTGFSFGIHVENTSAEINGKIPLQSTAAIFYLDGNIALANNATSGYGNSTHPYILENYVINGTGSGLNCIEIRNTNAYFILRNCTVFGGRNGIFLYNATNGELMNNTAHSNTRGSGDYEGNGIYLHQSHNNTLFNNIVYENTANSGGQYSGTGILLRQSSYNTLSENSIYNQSGWVDAGCGIQLCVDSDYNTITNNTICNNIGLAYSGGYGIYIRSGCDYNIMFNNIIHAQWGSEYYSGNGIWVSGNFNNVTKNSVFNNSGIGYDTGNGIVIWSANNNTVFGNICFNNTGIYVSPGDNTNGNGIHLKYADYNTLTNNVVFNNKGGSGDLSGNGILLYESENNRLTGNWAYNNTGGGGGLLGKWISFT